MSQPVVPRTFEQWKHCITVLCAIDLTPAYVAERIRALADPRDFSTQRFAQVWGAEHLRQVQEWFQRAQLEIPGAAPHRR